MDGMSLRELALRVATGLPAAEHCFPFGPEHEVCKVVGKVFFLTGELRGEPLVTLKCEPESSLALQEEFPEITPGYHMNKKHWISMRGGDGLDEGLVDELVRTSYTLVVDTLPRSKRPGLSARALKGVEPA
ncbi:MmcQ/YjbR family DNA-binding protein [Kineosporia succinea]|uniref:DNA-binding protein (MmcQ/YjbR family) n=1 Tax=Kineosporia succinea TaxID=84632 RepID=A0ABT9PBB1_9ACTN|nr:MmcQ/YjbR family DNA-binding protein [Kineosporia succinea]MDP9829993.1 putative DNA-binding protein (MmcQ/YjbR family) [Kineosporia succinea]